MRNGADQQLQRALQDLSGIHASPGFTERVLALLAQRRIRRRRRKQLALSLATATVLAIMAGIIAVNRSSGPTSAELANEARLLRQEHARLRRDLEALSESARDAAPVLYLGGDDDFDLVLDLAPIIARSAPAAATVNAPTDPYEL